MGKKTIEYWKDRLSEGLIMALIAIGVFVLSLALFVRGQQLPQLAEILPSETAWFLVMDLDDFARTDLQSRDEITQLLGEDITRENWFAGERGWASVGDEKIHVLKVKHPPEVRAFFKELAGEKDRLIEKHGITCFEHSYPNCFMFKRSLLLVSQGPAALQRIQEVRAKTNLEHTEAFQNAQRRLPYVDSLFAFINFKADELNTSPLLSQWIVPLERFHYGLSTLYPSATLSVTALPNEFRGELFTAVDKKRLKSKIYYRSPQKYTATFLEEFDALEKVSSTKFDYEWGGVDLAGQMKSLQEALDQSSPATGLLLKALLKPYASLLSQMEGEFYFAWSPGEDFLFVLEAPQITLDETWESWPKPDGNLQRARYEAWPYNRIDAPENAEASRLAMTVLDGKLVVSHQKETLFYAVDQIMSRQNSGKSSEYGGFLSGMDSYQRFSVNFAPTLSILKLEGESAEVLHVSHKFFDDGIFTRLLLQRP